MQSRLRLTATPGFLCGRHKAILPRQFAAKVKKKNAYEETELAGIELSTSWDMAYIVRQARVNMRDSI
jgi:hypothetical protein